MANTPNYQINYEDERFKQVETQKDQALNEVGQHYGEMIGNTDKYYQDLINQSKENADKLADVQNQNKDFAIEKIEQQREQYKKDYQREQSGAYVDWQKQSNQYGANAEQMAMQGLAGSGYAESSQVAMFTAYQNRVANAREVMAQANMNCDNGIKDAILQNNSALAEIYANANKEQLQIALEGFQYKNTLLENMMNQKQATEDRYYSRYQDVLAQMNQENALAEEVRQYNENLAMQQKQLAEEIRQFNLEIERLKAKDEQEYQLEIQQLELQKKQLEEEKRQFDASLKASQSSSSSRSSSRSSSGGSGGSYELGNHAVNTPYYQGSLNPDAKTFGTFSNGYQPKGISGHGKLSKTSDKVTLDTQYVYGASAGQKVTVTQNVWKAEDGTLWYWEGRDNKYKKLK